MGTDDTKDDWRAELAARLTAPKPGQSTFHPSAATELEIALGRARSEVTYALELCRSHGVPAMGSAIGDEVSLRLGEQAVAFRIDRLGARIVAKVPDKDEVVHTWDAEKRAVVAGGEGVDVTRMARGAIDTVVSAWRASAEGKRPPTVRELKTPPSEPPNAVRITAPTQVVAPPAGEKA